MSRRLGLSLALLVASALVLSLYVSAPLAAASGTVYTERPAYRFNEVVTVVISTPTGINNTRVLVYRPPGQVNVFNFGALGIGVWRFALGVAGPPAGPRTVVLMDGATTLFTTYYNVVEPETPPSSSAQTVTIYITATERTTVLQPTTITRMETETAKVTTTVTLPPPMGLVYIMFMVIVALAVTTIFLASKMVTAAQQATDRS